MIQDKISEELEKELEDQILFEALSESIDSNNSAKKKSSSKKTHHKKYSKSKNLKLRLKKGLTIKGVIMILMALLLNTYAWFIFLSQVDAQLEMHVQSWDVLMNGEGSKKVEIDIKHLYPGFKDDSASQTVPLANNGQMNASVTFELTYVQILDKYYVYGKDASAYDTYGLTAEQKANAQLITSQADFLALLDTLPFKVNILYDGTVYDGTAKILNFGSTTTLSLSVTWPYEVTGTDAEIETQDAIDTEWGEKAYDYYKKISDTDAYSVIIKGVIKAVQYETSFSTTGTT